jgi:hypothetical protein
MNEFLEQIYGDDVSTAAFLEVLSSVGKPVYSQRTAKYDIIDHVSVKSDKILVTLTMSGYCIPLDLFIKEYLLINVTGIKGE